MVVKLNPKSALARDEATACGLVAAVARALAARGGDAVAHPYPVTPLHGDYLLHADLAEAAKARFAGADGNVPATAAGGLKVRAEGALAASLVRPEWRADGADWDALIQEVDAGRLVASETTLVNGWMGPRWVRSGWFQAYRLLADTIADPEVRRRVEADVARLRSGDIADPTERANLERDLVRRLTAGCSGAVAGYTLKREYFNASFSDGIENIAHDALEGLQLADVPAHREAQGLSLERLAEARDRRAAAGGMEPGGRLHRRLRPPDVVCRRRSGGHSVALRPRLGLEPHLRGGGLSAMSHDPPLPAHRRPRLALRQRGERVGVRGSGTLQRRRLWLPLTLTLSPQAGRGNPVGGSGGRRRPATGAIVSLLLALCLMIGWAAIAHAAELTFDLKIEKGRVAKAMRTIRVKQGDAVTLRWTSDRPIVLHLHGYDIEKRVVPGAVTEMAFVARATGRFSVEEHKTDAKGGHSHGEAALVRIEVLPR